MQKTKSGFTIVELLIVIVVIGILAAITIVAFNGVQQRAIAASLSSDLQGAGKQLGIDLINNGQYPSTLSAANGGKGLSASPGTTYQYAVNNTPPQTYCLSANHGTASYNISSSTSPGAGPCPVGWWLLNGTTTDNSGNGNHGTNNGATPTSGTTGGADSAYSFNGSTYISLPNFDYDIMRSGKEAASWTLSVWARTTASNGSEDILLGRQGCNGGIYTWNGGYAFAIKTDGCWTNAQTIAYTPADMTAWHLLTAVYDNRAMTFYVDGSSVGTATFSATIYNYGSMIGIGSGGNSAYAFTGQLDDARAYNKALSAGDVQAIYIAGAR